MNMIRWEPIREMTSMEEAVDRLLDEHFFHPSRFISLWGETATILLDVFQTVDAVVVKASLPGIRPEDVDVTVSGNTLNIKGETKTEENVKSEDYIHQERRYGAFSRSVVLPAGLQGDKAEAVFEHGVLTLSIPRAPELKPKQIKVKAISNGKVKAIEGKKS